MKDVAGANVLDALADRIFKFRLGEIRFVSERYFSADIHTEAHIVEVQFVLGLLQLLDQEVDLPGSLFVSLSQSGGVLVAHIGQCQDGHCFLHVIEHHHVMVQREPQIGQLAIVVWCVGQPLDIAHRVVARIADCAADERRQLAEVCDVHTLNLPAQDLQRIVGLQ